jgi:hypothetical protein
MASNFQIFFKRQLIKLAVTEGKHTAKGGAS